MKACVRIIDGTPALFLDGERTAPMLYGLSDIPASAGMGAMSARNIAAFARAGVKLVAVDTGLHLGWHKVTPFNPEPLLAEVAAALDASPEAAVLIRLHLNPPYHFLRDHPEEQVIYRTPEGDKRGIDDGEHDRLIAHDGDGHLRASIASTVWRDAASEYLRLFLRALRSSPEGERVFAIQLAYGVYGEWHEFNCDVSVPMTCAFRRHLRERYGTDEALRAAWGDDTVTLNTAPFHPENFRPTEDGLFRDPHIARCTVDSQHTLQAVPAETILHFARIVKEETPEYLTGSFYGYLLAMGNPYTVIVGHLGAPLLYKNAQGLIDFLAGPFCYGECRDTDRMPIQRAMLETVRLHGLLWLTEMDQHPAGTEYTLGGDPARMRETVAMLRRNVMQPLLAGMGCWYYDHRLVPIVLPPDSENVRAASIYRKTGWWDSPECMAEIEKLLGIANNCFHSKGVAEVLFVYDTETFYEMFTAPYPDTRLHDAFGKSGATYDTVLLSDLALCDLSRYRVIVFANTYVIPKERMEEIRRCIKDKVAVFIYAAGFSDGERHSEEGIAALTGFRVARRIPTALVRLDAAFGGEEVENPYGAPSPFFVITGRADGEAAPLTPVAYAAESNAPLIDYPGKTENAPLDEGLSPSLGEVVAARAGNTWYLAAHCVTPTLARQICRAGGVHIYSESNEPLMANDRLLLLHSVTGGERTLVLRNGTAVTYKLLPHTALVVDAQTGETVLAP